MAEVVACLTRGKVIVLQAGQERHELRSAYAAAARGKQPPMAATFVDISRGRRSDELCYAVSVGGVSSVLTQVPGSGEERRLFAAEALIRDLDFSFADEALACTVYGNDGTSAIGLLTDDGKGMRTVTEGDVLDREPRWAPGGRGEIVYASAGIGRSKSGVWVGLSPFALHRLNLAASTVEVLVSDAKYDYSSPVALSSSLIYALRGPYRASPAKSHLAVMAAGLLAPFRKGAPPAPGPNEGNALGHELMRITEKGIEAVAQSVLAFDVNAEGVIVYSNGSGVLRTTLTSPSTVETIADLADVEQLVIC